MRLEVRSLGNGLRREHIGVFDADTGKRIEWVQSVKLKFNVEGALGLSWSFSIIQKLARMIS